MTTAATAPPPKTSETLQTPETSERRLPAGGERVRRWLKRSTGGLIVFPIVVLFTLFFFDEFDTAAFNVLVPDIERAFHLTDAKITTIIILNVSVVLLIGIPVGYYGDRLPRRAFVWMGGIIAGVFSFLTGVAGAVALLVLFRFGNGVGRLVNGPIHRSLLSDYYRPEDRPAIFSLHQNAPQAAAVIGPVVAGALASLFNWRVAFMVLIIPIVAVALFSIRLPEPLRGGTDDRQAAEAVQFDRPMPFDRAARMLMSVKTLRRQYVAWIFIGAGYLPLLVYLPLFLKRAFHVAPFGRGLFSGAAAAATFVGVQLSKRATMRWLAKDLGDPLKKAGWVLFVIGPGLVVYALSPTLWFALVVGVSLSFVAGFFYVPFLTVQTVVSPAKVRSLSYGFSDVFLIAGVWLLFILTGINHISDHEGIRAGLVAISPFWLVGGILLWSGARFVKDDASYAMEVLHTAAKLRADRQSAASDLLLVVRDVSVAYDTTQVLFGVNFEVREGELVALLGTNGAGKSTLLKTISGLVHPIGGAVYFDGEDITQFQPEETASIGIIQMPGGKSVFPSLTVRENLELATWLYTGDRAYVEDSLRRVYEIFPILASRSEQQAGNLSGGEQQMLSLGQAFIAKPRLLMIDELSLGLAPVVVQQLLEIVEEIHARGTTIILVEQSVNIALTVAHHAYFMEKGEIRFDGATSELLTRTDILRSVFLEGATSLVGDGSSQGSRAATRRRR